ncbi:hypothetical protein Pcar_3444 [Syntrophotalea carbinolica DSM 2380]|uniref:Uncharacterized protein n=1 Tax=Syntrophotalea carbinolica (strain DSM 2380 / NBRC 103641 / GraBd1) TaxID=338963 RepID=J9UIT2_SYNC1|nr:hypothetical protein Pcar_3444 [Syntrophotalea carbinolica DSM 2380]
MPEVFRNRSDAFAGQGFQSTQIVIGGISIERRIARISGLLGHGASKPNRPSLFAPKARIRPWSVCILSILQCGRFCPLRKPVKTMDRWAVFVMICRIHFYFYSTELGDNA